MKICRYDDGLPGLVDGDTIYPLADALAAQKNAPASRSMNDLIGAMSDVAFAKSVTEAARRGKGIPLASAKLIAPNDSPPAIWAAAANYRAHQAEMTGRVGAYDRSKMSPDELMAEVFLKPNSSIIGPGGTIVLPTMASHVDFECELCAVIGRTAKNVSREDALDYVFGYTMCWDISVRDPWGRAPNTRNIRKGFDTFCGIGPWFVSADEIADPHNLNIKVDQNGHTAMQAFTGDMINGLRDLIRFISSVSTLKPGTLLTTGTPHGVSKLEPGDRLKGSIDSIGIMELDVVAQKE